MTIETDNTKGIKASEDQPQGYHGTVFCVSRDRLAPYCDKLQSLGFQPRKLDMEKVEGHLDDPVIFLVDSESWRTYKDDILGFARDCHYPPPVIQIEDGDFGDESPPNLGAVLSADFSEKQFFTALFRVFRNYSLQCEVERLTGLLDSGHSELQKLISIGISLSSERNIDRLMDKIIREACNITTSDSGSIYIIDEIIDEIGEGEKVLRFRNTHCASLDVDFKEFIINIGPGSIAGYVALTGESLIIDDCYNIPEMYEFSINRSFDESNNYRTKSMLAVAMRNQKDEITGVIQLINRKPSEELILSSPDVVEENVIPFDEQSRNLIGALASQAAVALENYRLYSDIENLFEGLVQASVTAIESRDPTTCGHSERVSVLTVGIAEQVNRTKTGPLKEIHFTVDQLKEIRYAGLLHDFGKVGVRENVLLKAKKLYPYHLDVIKKRFEVAKQISRREAIMEKTDILLARGREEYLSHFENLDRKMKKQLETLDLYLASIIAANEPTMLHNDDFSRLEEIAQMIICNPDEKDFSLLDEEEYRILSISKGSLTPEEIHDVQSHVSHSYNFLTKIPWTSELSNIPEIAHGHHEKLDGHGYPQGIAGEEICIQARMMAIADIYDALTANDRPYKPAMPVDKALEILGYEARDGKIDSELLKLFVDKKIYELSKD